jgi:nucleoside-diphosphate-sugar epimerase
MKRILVTGGTGFIGAELVKNLVNKGNKVRTFDDNSRGGLDKLGQIAKDVEIVEGDIRNPESVANAMQNIDIVYHLAFINGTRYFYEKPNLVLEVGLKGTLNVMDSAIKHDVERLIFASSAEVYQQPTHIPTTEEERLIIPNPKNPRYSYGGAKAIGELMTLHYAKDAELETVIFRPHNVYGPNMGYEHVIPELIMRMKKLSNNFEDSVMDFPIQGTGKETRAFCFVGDAAEGIVIVGEKGGDGEIYHIGTENEVSIKKVVNLIASQFNIDLTITTTSSLEGATDRRCPSIEKAQKMGYAPKISLEEGVKITSDWYMNYDG